MTNARQRFDRLMLVEAEPDYPLSPLAVNQLSDLLDLADDLEAEVNRLRIERDSWRRRAQWAEWSVEGKPGTERPDEEPHREQDQPDEHLTSDRLDQPGQDQDAAQHPQQGEHAGTVHPVPLMDVLAWWDQSGNVS